MLRALNAPAIDRHLPLLMTDLLQPKARQQSY